MLAAVRKDGRSLYDDKQKCFCESKGCLEDAGKGQSVGKFPDMDPSCVCDPEAKEVPETKKGERKTPPPICFDVEKESTMRFSQARGAIGNPAASDEDRLETCGQLKGVVDGPGANDAAAVDMERCTRFSQRKGVADGEGLKSAADELETFGQSKGVTRSPVLAGEEEEGKHTATFGQAKGVCCGCTTDAEETEAFCQVKGVCRDPTTAGNGENERVEFYGQARGNLRGAGLKGVDGSMGRRSLAKAEVRIAGKGSVDDVNGGMEKTIAFVQLKGISESDGSGGEAGLEKLPAVDEACRCETTIYVKGTPEEAEKAKQDWLDSCDCGSCADCESKAEKTHQLVQMKAQYGRDSIIDKDRLSTVSSFDKMDERDVALLEDAPLSDLAGDDGGCKVDDGDDCQCDKGPVAFCECPPKTEDDEGEGASLYSHGKTRNATTSIAKRADNEEAEDFNDSINDSCKCEVTVYVKGTAEEKEKMHAEWLNDCQCTACGGQGEESCRYGKADASEAAEQAKIDNKNKEPPVLALAANEDAPAMEEEAMEQENVHRAEILREPSLDEETLSMIERASVNKESLSAIVAEETEPAEEAQIDGNNQKPLIQGLAANEETPGQEQAIEQEMVRQAEILREPNVDQEKLSMIERPSVNKEALSGIAPPANFEGPETIACPDDDCKCSFAVYFKGNEEDKNNMERDWKKDCECAACPNDGRVEKLDEIDGVLPLAQRDSVPSLTGEKQSRADEKKSSLRKEALTGIAANKDMEGLENFDKPDDDCKCSVSVYVKGNEEDKDDMEHEWSKDCECPMCSTCNNTEELEKIDGALPLVQRDSVPRMDEEKKSSLRKEALTGVAANKEVEGLESFEKPDDDCKCRVSVYAKGNEENKDDLEHEWSKDCECSMCATCKQTDELDTIDGALPLVQNSSVPSMVEGNMSKVQEAKTSIKRETLTGIAANENVEGYENLEGPDNDYKCSLSTYVKGNEENKDNLEHDWTEDCECPKCGVKSQVEELSKIDGALPVAQKDSIPSMVEENTSKVQEKKWSVRKETLTGIAANEDIEGHENLENPDTDCKCNVSVYLKGSEENRDDLEHEWREDCECHKCSPDSQMEKLEQVDESLLAEQKGCVGGAAIEKPNRGASIIPGANTEFESVDELKKTEKDELIAAEDTGDRRKSRASLSDALRDSATDEKPPIADALAERRQVKAEYISRPSRLSKNVETLPMIEEIDKTDNEICAPRRQSAAKTLRGERKSDEIENRDDIVAISPVEAEMSENRPNDGQRQLRKSLVGEAAPETVDAAQVFAEDRDATTENVEHPLEMALESGRRGKDRRRSSVADQAGYGTDERTDMLEMSTADAVDKGERLDRKRQSARGSVRCPYDSTTDDIDHPMETKMESGLGGHDVRRSSAANRAAYGTDERTDALQTSTGVVENANMGTTTRGSLFQKEEEEPHTASLVDGSETKRDSVNKPLICTMYGVTNGTNAEIENANMGTTTRGSLFKKEEDQPQTASTVEGSETKKDSVKMPLICTRYGAAKNVKNEKKKSEESMDFGKEQGRVDPDSRRQSKRQSVSQREADIENSEADQFDGQNAAVILDEDNDRGRMSQRSSQKSSRTGLKEATTVSTKKRKTAPATIPCGEKYEGSSSISGPDKGCKCDLVVYAKGTPEEIEQLRKDFAKDCDCAQCSDQRIADGMNCASPEEAEALESTDDGNVRRRSTRDGARERQTSTQIQDDVYDCQAEEKENGAMADSVSLRERNDKQRQSCSCSQTDDVCDYQAENKEDGAMIDAVLAPERKSILKEAKTVSTRNTKMAPASIPCSEKYEGSSNLSGPDKGCKCDLVVYAKGSPEEIEQMKKDFAKDCDCAQCSDRRIAHGMNCASPDGAQDATVSPDVLRGGQGSTKASRLRSETASPKKVDFEGSERMVHQEDRLTRNGAPQKTLDTATYSTSEKVPEMALNNAAQEEGQLQRDSTPQRSVDTCVCGASEKLPERALNNAAENEGQIRRNSIPQRSMNPCTCTASEKVPEMAMNSVAAGRESTKKTCRKLLKARMERVSSSVTINEGSEKISAGEDGCKCDVAIYVKCDPEDKDSIEQKWMEDCDCDGCVDERRVKKCGVDGVAGMATADGSNEEAIEDLATGNEERIVDNEDDGGNRPPTGRHICTIFQVAQLAEENYHLTQDAIDIGRQRIESVDEAPSSSGVGTGSESKKRRSSSMKRAERASMSTQTTEEEAADKFACTCQQAGATTTSTTGRASAARGEDRTARWDR